MSGMHLESDDIELETWCDKCHKKETPTDMAGNCAYCHGTYKVPSAFGMAVLRFVEKYKGRV